MRESAEWFTEAATYAVVAQAYQEQGLIGNAHYFARESIRCLAHGLAALAAEITVNAIAEAVLRDVKTD